MNIKAFLNSLVGILKYLIRWKFKISFNKVCLRYFSTLIVICGGVYAIDWTISRNAQGQIQWSLSNSDIGKHQLIIVIIVSLIFLAYLFFNDRKEIREMLKNKKQPLTQSQTKALKDIYDALNNEQNEIDTYTLNVLSRGGIDWYSQKEVVAVLPSLIKDLERIINDQRAFIKNDLFLSLLEHTEHSKRIPGSLWSLAAELSRVDQDQLTDIIDMVNNQDREMLDFVIIMMNKLNDVDRHPVYIDYKKLYREQKSSGIELLKIIKNLLEPQ